MPSELEHAVRNLIDVVGTSENLHMPVNVWDAFNEVERCIEELQAKETGDETTTQTNEG